MSLSSKEILELKLKGFTQTEIANKLNMTQANVSWYYNQEYFKQLELETKELDKGEVNIEDEN